MDKFEGGTITVKSGKLGTNCWLPHRFYGGRCERVMYCKYPEKQTCKAVPAEIEFIKQNSKEKVAQIKQKAKEDLGRLIDKL